MTWFEMREERDRTFLIIPVVVTDVTHPARGGTLLMC